MRRAFPLILGVAGLALPLAAWANAGIGFLMVSVPFLVMALLPAILVEAPILAHFLKLTITRGLWWSCLANVVSTVGGAVIAFPADILLLASTGSTGMTMSRAGALISLVPMFFVTWWLEKVVIRALQPKGATGSPARATFAANATSCFLLALAIAFWPSDTLDYPPAEARWRLSEAILAMGIVRSQAADDFAATGRFPDAKSIPVTTRYLRSLALEKDGRVVAVLHFPGVRGLDGRRLVLEPRVESGKIVAWLCYTPDAAHKYLPANCRNGPPVPAGPGAGRPVRQGDRAGR